jgi:hypothetical protein
VRQHKLDDVARVTQKARSGGRHIYRGSSLRVV